MPGLIFSPKCEGKVPRGTVTVSDYEGSTPTVCMQRKQEQLILTN